MFRGIACPTCNEMILFIDKHKCHEKVLKRVEEQVDAVINDELLTFEEELDAFGRSKDVQFMKFMLQQERKDTSGEN